MQGQVLNLTSAWWMRQACSHVPNALLAVPHPNVAIIAKCTGMKAFSSSCWTCALTQPAWNQPAAIAASAEGDVRSACSMRTSICWLSAQRCQTGEEPASQPCMAYLTPLNAKPDLQPEHEQNSRCAVYPVEFVVRGYLTGSTDTSLWTHYKAGKRKYCGNSFPDGMVKNDRLEQVASRARLP